MEIDNLKKWLDLAQGNRAESLWNQIFSDKAETSDNFIPFSGVQNVFPKCDLYEAEEKLVLEIEIPGIERDNICISIYNQLLIISGKFQSLHTKRKYYLKERSDREFKKEITLPVPVLVNKISSELINGILVINLPLAKEEMTDIPIFIDIHASN